MSDSIADFLIRIKNASMSGRAVVTMPFSRTKESLANVLKKEDFLQKVEVSEAENKKYLTLTLVPEGKGLRIIEVKRISKPGRRVYVKAKDVKKLRKGLGMTVISSPSGLLTDREAIKKNLGGEVLCKII